MLEILNELMLFFEDCYREVTVREYARLVNISPPTASSKLSHYKHLGLLESRKERLALLYSANRESDDFRDLSRMYWRKQLSNVTQCLVHTLVTPTIILYGSLAKAETAGDSDIDIAVFAKKKNVQLEKYEKRLGRSIHILVFKSFSDVPQELAHNIINGYVLYGRLRWTGKDAVKSGL